MPCEFRLQACYVHIGVMRRKEDKILVIVKCVDMSQNFTLSRTLFFFLAEYIFAAVLGLYMDEKTQSFPNSDKVLICSSETTSEEVLTLSLPQKYDKESQYLHELLDP